MLRNKIILAIIANYVLRTSLFVSFMNASTSEQKRELDNLTCSTSAKRICTNPSLEITTFGILPFEIITSMCRLCRFQHDFINISENSKVVFHGLTLIHVENASCFGQESMNEYLCSPAHLNCVFLQICLFLRVHSDLCRIKGSSFADTYLLSMPRFTAELKWLAFVLKYVAKIASNTNNGTQGLLKIDGQVIKPNTELNVDWLRLSVCSGLPELVKAFIRRYYAELDTNNLASQLETHSSNMHKPVFDSEICKEMLKTPLLFYTNFEKNIEKLKALKLKPLDYLSSESQKQLVQKDLTFLEKEQLNYTIESIENQISSILNFLDLELFNIYIKNNNQCVDNYPLKVIFIVLVIQTLPHKVMTQLKPYVIIRLSKIITQYKLDNDADREAFSSFHDLIYKLLATFAILPPGFKDKEITARINVVQEFINFINDFKSLNDQLVRINNGESELSIRELKRKITIKRELIAFWIAKLMLNATFNNVPVFCYILYKLDLMSEPSIFTIFRSSFFIRNLISKQNRDHAVRWFELGKKGKQTNRNILRARNFVERKTFIAKWKEQQDKDNIIDIKDLKNLGRARGSEKNTLNKVYDLLKQFYSDLNSIINMFEIDFQT